jgi:formamidopyrimidine-DNA glycosylase
MPELPEVEITRRQIRAHLVGRSIARVVTTKNSYFFLTPPKSLARHLEGRHVVELERHGKYLIARLDDDRRLLLHLGMTGQLFTSNASSVRLLRSHVPQLPVGFEPDEHTHLCLHFSDDGPAVFFRDVRKFGKVGLLDPRSDKRLRRLGVDALTVTGEELFARSRKRHICLKSFLLNQAVLAGVGNIYADEALFLAKLRPTKKAQTLTRKSAESLAAQVRHVLERAIGLGGSTIRDFVTPEGESGCYQRERLVYARTAEPCVVCQTPIRRTVLGGRSTHYCAICQK